MESDGAEAHGDAYLALAPAPAAPSAAAPITAAPSAPSSSSTDFLAKLSAVERGESAATAAPAPAQAPAPAAPRKKKKAAPTAEEKEALKKAAAAAVRKKPKKAAATPAAAGPSQSAADKRKLTEQRLANLRSGAGASSSVAPRDVIEGGAAAPSPEKPKAKRKGKQSAADDDEKPKAKRKDGTERSTGSGHGVGKTKEAAHSRNKKKVPSLAPKASPRRGPPGLPNGLSLEINLAYIDSSQVVVDRALQKAKAPAGAADPDDGPPEKANLLEDKKFDKQSWMDEQARLSAMMSNMYQ